MTIHFRINFHTVWGQNLYITGSLPELGGGDISRAVPMHCCGGGFWEKGIRIVSLRERLLSYKYFVKSDDGVSFFEAGAERTLGLNNASKELFLLDEWQGNSCHAPLLTAPFSDVFYSHKDNESTQMHLHIREVIIRVTAPAVEQDCILKICGSSGLLGHWDPDKAPAMTPVRGSRWVISLPADRLEDRLEYKFIKYSTENGAVTWEERDNRVLDTPRPADHQTWSVEHSMAAFPLCRPRFFGTAVPVFSLRSSTSCGIGDFTDLKALGEWAKAAGQNIIQILPVNDTTSTWTWTDSYPYSGISVMALHPIYINITGIGPLRAPGDKAAYRRGRKALDALSAVDYEKVLAFKMKYLRIQFRTYSADTFTEPGFLSFYRRNREWLLPYCIFCALRDRYGTADFTAWGDDSRCTPELIARYNTKGNALYPEISFHLFVQYHLHLQLLESVRYLHSLGVALKGDIPIGITRNSADAWASPELFHRDSQAGAPPDSFSADGQNWGFPTYNWEEMARTDYSWWRKRLVKMSEYFDAYRMDHVLGFFRIWEIPVSQVKGTMGHFSPAPPMSIGEIRSFGLDFDRSRHARPYIRPDMLRSIFGDSINCVTENYLCGDGRGGFSLKPGYDTQRMIEDAFGPEPGKVKDGLMSLVSEILFQEDSTRPGMFHPMIAARDTYSYRDLPQDQKDAFDRLHEHFFYKRHDSLWRASAMRRLPVLISATDMLPCAEDLGMIPDCVPGTLRDLHILTLEIFRMPKTPGVEFADPRRYPYLSVCTTGTHDTSTLRAWWEEDSTLSARFYHGLLHGKGDVPQQCAPQLCADIIRLHTSSPSMLTILPLQDWLSADGGVRAPDPSSERINVPSDPRHYWRYRMHRTLEELTGDQGLMQRLRSLTGK